MKGNSTVLGVMEKKGLALFMYKGCAACHGGVNAGGGGDFPFGVLTKPDAEVLPPDDKGRFTVTNTAADEYVFKSPSLRNIAITAPYFHSGAVWELDRAVEIMGSVQLGQQLSEDEARTIVAFLQTLMGVQPVVEYPTLPTHTAETPLPDVSVEAAESSH